MTLAFFRRFPRLHRLVHRNMPSDRYAYGSCLICRFVWWRLLQDRRFREGLDRGLADHAAGRFTPWSEVKRRLP